MRVLCDFTVIQGDSTVRIGDNSGSEELWTANFRTGGRQRDEFALLIFNVRGLTHTDSKVHVNVNGYHVGDIYPYFPGGSDVDRFDINDPNKARHMGHWYTQMIILGGDKLKEDEENILSIRAVEFPGNDSTPTNRLDDFELKDVICFFHQ